jgi:hypothetical protein
MIGIKLGTDALAAKRQNAQRTCLTTKNAENTKRIKHGWEKATTGRALIIIA